MQKKVSFDRHHRKPRSIGGGNERKNISFVPRHLHEHWHGLFQNWTAQQIADEINQTWLDPDFIFVVQRR